MPTYLYECQTCQTRYEEQLSVSERDAPCERGFCSNCNTDAKIIRVIGNSGGFQLKGSGWAKDGYATYLGDVKE